MDENKKTEQQAKLVFAIGGWIVLMYLVLHCMQVRYGNSGANIFEIVTAGLTHCAEKPFELGHVFSDVGTLFLSILAVTGIYVVTLMYARMQTKLNEHEDPRTAQGSSDWNRDFKGYAEKFTIPQKNKEEPDQNMILGKGLRYGLKPGRNVNVVIMGSAGSGKSFGVIKPNILQMNSSYVVTDPSGEIFRSMAHMLLDHGYNVKLFSTSNMENSNCYNPFDYIYAENGEVDETRVTSMVSMFLQNATELQNNKGGDKFWDQASKALLIACSMLLLEFFPDQDHNMYQILKLVQKGKVSESKSDDQTELDKIFEEKRKINPDAHCFSSYDTFKLAPARTANSILISAAVDLNMFNQTKVRNMTTTSYQVRQRNLAGQISAYAHDAEGNLIRTDDNIDLRTVGDEKTAIFVNIPQADGTFNFLVSMMYAQLFESLYGRAEKICPRKYLVTNKIGQPILTMLDSEETAKTMVDLYKNAQVVRNEEDKKDVYYVFNQKAGSKYSHPGYNKGCMKKFYSKRAAEDYIKGFSNCSIKRGKAVLPWHVQCLLDEFSNIGSIPEFPQKLATMRKYEISCMIVLQSLAQLKNRYDKLFSDILSNCDNTIFLGTSDPETCEYISKRLGPKTIKIQTHGTSSSGKGKSSSTNTNLTKRELMTPDEVSRIPGDMSIVLTNGQKPFLVKKYRALDHPNWKLSGDDNRDFAIEPTEYAHCTEKSFAASGEAAAMGRNLQNAAHGQDRNGKPLAETCPINSPQDVSKAVGENPNDPSDLAKRAKSKKKTTTYVVDENIPTVPKWKAS